MPTDGTDVKVYTVADDYAHAEARKSPALDGKVERDFEGKEIRYPVILTPREKLIAKRVAKVVRQQICGFDLLRANGMSYVCDVNGFSFVKTSRKYYEDCSHILGFMLLRSLAPRLCPPSLGLIAPGSSVDIPLVPTTCGTIMELRCVIAIFRHGDRTPKQKMKMEVRHERFLQLYRKYAGERANELKLKKPKQLQEVLDIVRTLLHELESGKSRNPEVEEKRTKFEQLRYVLEMHGSFSGINRKIQLKYQPYGRQSSYKKDKIWKEDGRWSSGESSSGRDDKEAESTNRGASLLLVFKWGGELTARGRQQAEDLGRAFRCLYPGGEGNYGKNPGLGLLRLHSTYRHDLKMYASDEGRVQMTAAAFAKGFLALEGELPPILVQMVKSANTNGLLDNDNDCHHYQQLVKARIREVMSKRADFSQADVEKLVPIGARSLINAMAFVRNPHEACTRLFGYVQRLANRVAMLTANPRERSAFHLYHSETWDLLLRRWAKLVKDFQLPSGLYDLSKLSDIYDNIKYDAQHNPSILIKSEMLEFFSLARALADIVVPQEYGITKAEKLVIAQRICTPLMRKILSDARYTGVDECTRLHSGYSKGVASPDRFVRTRLYFTSESHLHSLLTCLRYGGLADCATDEQWRRAMDYVSCVPELNYLSQIVIMIYEDPAVETKTDQRFHVELHFSPGTHALCRDLPAGTGFRPGRRECPSSRISVESSVASLSKTSLDSNLNDADTADRDLLHNVESRSENHTLPCKDGLHLEGAQHLLRNRAVSLHSMPYSQSGLSPCRASSLDRYSCLHKNTPADSFLGDQSEKPKDFYLCQTSIGDIKRSPHKSSHLKCSQTSTAALGNCKDCSEDPCGHKSRRSNAEENALHPAMVRSHSTVSPLFLRSFSSGPLAHTLLVDEADRTITHEGGSPDNLWRPEENCPDRRKANLCSCRRPLSAHHFNATKRTDIGRFTVTRPPESRAIDLKGLKYKPADPWKLWSPAALPSSSRLSKRDSSPETLDAEGRTPSGSLHCLFPPTLAPGRDDLSGESASSSLIRRASHGVCPRGETSIRRRTSSSESLKAHTSLNSLPNRCLQNIKDFGAPVAQWLMEYFDQLEKKKWTPFSEVDEKTASREASPAESAIKGVSDHDSDGISFRVRGTSDRLDFTNPGDQNCCIKIEDSEPDFDRRRSTGTILNDLLFLSSGPDWLKFNQKNIDWDSAKDANQIEDFNRLLSADMLANSASKMSTKELNAFTYPNNLIQLDLSSLSKVAQKISSPYPCGLISTAVIRGSQESAMSSNSVPNFSKFRPLMTEIQQEAHDVSLLAPCAPSVPEIYPLETLHNAMTLSQLENFLARLTTHKFPTPFASPLIPSTPVDTLYHISPSSSLQTPKFGSFTSPNKPSTPTFDFF